MDQGATTVALKGLVFMSVFVWVVCIEPLCIPMIVLASDGVEVERREKTENAME